MRGMNLSAMRFALVTCVVALTVLSAAAPQPVGQKTGTAVPITKRSGLVNLDESIKIEALHSHIASTKAKVLRGLANFQKSTGASHPAALTGAERRATGADVLTDDNSQLWYGSISVGTPPSTFTVDFDTGSSDLFLPGTTCALNCAGHSIYNPGISSTSQDLRQTFEILYGDGSAVLGEQFSDTLTISGLTAVNQTLGVASQLSSAFDIYAFPPDGLMGMGFQSISTYHASPVFQSLISQGQVDEPVFSFKLTASGAELYLGGANSALYTGDFSYTPVTKAGYWEVNIDSVDGNGQTILNNIDSIIDTGTTVIIGDSLSVASLHDALGGKNAATTVGQGYYTFPCDSFPSNVSFTFGGRSFPISATALNIGPVSSGSDECMSGIVGQDTGTSFWIVGDVFLQNVYTSFDAGNMRVGFAQLA